MTARDELDRALIDLATKGERPRCGWPDVGPWFTSDDPEERARAARRCHGCPVFTQCAAAGEGESWGIWAGVDRGPHRPPTTRRKD